LNFKKLMLALDKMISEELEEDPLARVRIKTLMTGLKAVEKMKQHPEIEHICVELLVSHMELYGELLVMSQVVGSTIPSEEESIAMILGSAKEIGDA